MEDMYKRSAQEVQSLKERLAERQQYARRSRASEEVMRDQMLEAKSKVDEERTIKRELTYGQQNSCTHTHTHTQPLHTQHVMYTETTNSDHSLIPKAFPSTVVGNFYPLQI